MKLNLSVFKNKKFIQLMAFVAVMLLIWFVLPLISIEGGCPFASTIIRIAFLVIAVVVYQFRLIINFFQTHGTKGAAVIWENLKKLIHFSKTSSIEVSRYGKEQILNLNDKIKRDQKRRRMRRLPWYLVLGSPNSGKKTLIKQLGLYFYRPEQVGEEAINCINQCPDFDWWFSEKAVFINSAKPLADLFNEGWRAMLKMLKRDRKKRPLNGIILSLSLVELITYSNKERQDFLQTIAGYLREIHQRFGSLVPVYLIFNKCDQVEGFMEFFNDLSKEELHQVWGMTMPLEKSFDIQAVQQWFNHQYTLLTDQLKKRAMWCLDSERSIRGRELINAFPQQMMLLRKPIDNVIHELFGAVRYQKALQFRGIYFTSCDQSESYPHDFVLQAMSKKFQLVPPRFVRPARLGESYFVRSLLFSVILPEAGYLGESQRSKHFRQIGYRLFLIGSPLLILLGGAGMYGAYRQNQQNLTTIGQYLSSYQDANRQFNQTDPSLEKTFELLNPLNRAHHLYYDQSHLRLRWLFISSFIVHSVDGALMRTLDQVFMPRVAANLEAALNKNITDQNLLYAMLKGYLAYSAQNDTPSSSIRAPMEFAWNQQFPSSSETEKGLRYYLDCALNGRVEKLPLDNDLISRVRNQLENVDPAKRAYGLLSLRVQVQNLSDLYLSTPIGNDFHRLFIEKSDKVAIPALYTGNGYHQLFIKHYHSIANEVAQDNRDIGLANESNIDQSASQIINMMERNYSRDYVHAWNLALNNISIRPFNSLNDAIDTLTLLAGSQSPFRQLLNVIYDNTASVQHGRVRVSQVYNLANNFGRSGVHGASWPKSVALINMINKMLKQVQSAQDPNKASFNLVLKLVKEADSGNNPIATLLDEAQGAPQPIQGWLIAIAQNSWATILFGAHQYVNESWENDVMSVYRKSIRNRFPLNPHAISDVNIKDFNQFFGHKGVLSTFFDNYIKPFVHINQPDWPLYQFHQCNIGFSKKTIQLFKQFREIQDDYFTKGSSEANFSFSIQPLSLDANASSMEFIIGDQHIDYSHGPRSMFNIDWPLPFNNEYASLYVTGFSDNQFGHSASGPWALFKILSHGNFRQSNHNGTYLFTVDFQGLKGSYQITGADDMNLFTMKHLRGFNLPDQLTNNVEVKYE